MEQIEKYIIGVGGEYFMVQNKILMKYNNVALSLKKNYTAAELQTIDEIIDNCKEGFKKILVNWYCGTKVLDIDFKAERWYIYNCGVDCNIILTYILNNKGLSIKFSNINSMSDYINQETQFRELMEANYEIERFHCFQLGCLNKLPPSIMRIIFKYSLAGTVFE